eukprot:TRINITY_DN67602_c0_g1_i1.p1 TRINITY_DN67602_c0_g1~~TRINITY_DN67602_c0_g1_i1.p1  ORF type:complete len:386 (-),score=27.62 TRINITY_DN67602_c0_g1_i1:289-1398(-)
MVDGLPETHISRECQETIEIQCIRAIRAWKDNGYLGQALNDTSVADGVSIENLPPEKTGFTRWIRQTGNADAYRDPDGTARGTATLATSAASAGTPRNVFLYLHGGGYRKYKPTDGYVLAISTRLAKECSAPVLAIDYRLAPEFTVASRAAVQDVIAAVRWLHERFPESRIFLAGDSAGAGLALASVLSLLEHRDVPELVVDAKSLLDLVAGIVLLSPYIDLTMTSPGFKTTMYRYDDAFGDIFYTNHCRTSNEVADREWLRNRAMDYIGDSKPDDPYCSPVYIPDDALAQFPPILALVGGHEIYLHETTQLSERAQRLGVNCSLRVFPRMWHDWFNFCEVPVKAGVSSSELEAALATYSCIARWIEST